MVVELGNSHPWWAIFVSVISILLTAIYFFLKNNLESVTKSVTLNLRKKCNVSEVLILCGLLEGKMAGGQGFEPW